MTETPETVAPAAPGTTNPAPAGQDTDNASGERYSPPGGIGGIGAFTERLRAHHHWRPSGLGCSCGRSRCSPLLLLDHIDELQAERDRLQARLDAVRAQHRRDDEDNCCVCWDVDGNFPLAWPCDTIHALDCPEPEADVRAAGQAQPAVEGPMPDCAVCGASYLHHVNTGAHAYTIPASYLFPPSPVDSGEAPAKDGNDG